MKKRALLLIGLLSLVAGTLRSEPTPVRFAIVGLVHDHARGFIPTTSSRKDIQLVAIVEPNRELAARYAKDSRLADSLFHTSLETMLDRVKPQAVATFTSTFDHRRVVEACAAKGVHVMMEKPLAVSLEHARAIEAAAKKGGIEVMVNYETTWYPANHAAYTLIHERNEIGELRKIVVRDGHQGPKEIGCSAAFLEWLTEPVLNGGGALTDFGCYGADLITWLMKGQRPTSVFAVTQQIKPQVYPKVDDEATIVLTYPQAQGIIQASWNWPFNRKDMEVYGRTGYVLVPDQNRLQVRRANGTESDAPVPALAAPHRDPLSYLVAVVRGEMRPTGLSSLEVNLIATEILDAARESAQTGKRVALPTPDYTVTILKPDRLTVVPYPADQGTTNLVGKSIAAIFGPLSEVRVELEGANRTAIDGDSQKVEQKIRERIDHAECLGRDSEIAWHKAPWASGYLLLHEGGILPVKILLSGIVVGDLLFAEKRAPNDAVKGSPPTRSETNGTSSAAGSPR